MTGKRKEFCKRYTIHFNATKAAKESGFSEKTAYSIGQELLKKPEIQVEIQHIMKNRAKKVEITANDVLNEYKLIGLSDVKNYFYIIDGELRLKSFEDMTPDISRAIESIKQTKVSTISKKGNEYITLKTEIKLWSKPNALEMISRHTGGFIEKKALELPLNAIFVFGTANHVKAESKPGDNGKPKNRIKGIMP